MKRLVSTLFISAITLSSTALASSLNVKTFNPGPDAIFPVTSTLVYGDHDAILVDAQFQKKNAQQVVDMVKQSGRNLKYIFISYNDPDYYFGVDEIKKAFPQAQIVSTAQTAYLISATKDVKMTEWKEKLGVDAPEKLFVPDVINSAQINIDDQVIHILQDEKDTAHTYLWIPSLKTLLGSNSVSTGRHLWMADTPTLRDIDLWLKRVENMKALKPEKVIPGHYINNDMSPDSLNFVKKYLTDYKNSVVNHHNDSGAIISDMKKKYPELADEKTLNFGAKIFTGESTWPVASAYPPIGKTAEVNFGGTVFKLHFKDNKVMSFEGLAGAFKDVKDTVEYTAIEVSKNVFMVYWHEPNTKYNVVHLQDWNNGTVYTNIAGADSSFIHLKGTIKID
ncbi:MBL fold metallo-hydrolase [Pantoea agglomerans]|uniref:MBL fold metallo-hydrolase n=1 Tax=Enterobacter agglomerans TaxID=549 RepID=UPI00057DC62C|nr:MBL fold metallo-hydrolase [Pantoea agglomerans]KIC85300.1 metallo-beta-lactamase [Pantoea agglomerans]MBA5702570.1 MBL fold metallo-hydrolase [Pantoea agglomerans]SUB25474.1 Arsenate reductase and related proteins, glutaredoxin family [Pantoea agglomerans]